MSKLVLFLPDGSARDIKLDSERLMIGRRPDNDICLPYPAVSGDHAAIVTILDDSFLEDQGSTNGTLVNGRSVTKHFLRDRDQIEIGRQRMVYVVDESATLEPSRAALARTPERVLGERVAEAGKARSVEPAPVAISPKAPALAPRTSAPAVTPEASPAPVGTPAVATPPAPAAESVPAASSVPVIRVLTGANAGRSLPLTKGETLVGRAGLQIAALRRTPEGILLVPLEGEHAPAVNGTPAQPGGSPVKTGDIVEIAGARLELMAPEPQGRA